MAGAPGDKRVASQAKASLAVALVADWKLNPQNETELATLMKDIDPAFGRMRSVTNEVKTKLAIAYAAANRIVDAEFLAHTVSGDDFERWMLKTTINLALVQPPLPSSGMFESGAPARRYVEIAFGLAPFDPNEGLYYAAAVGDKIDLGRMKSVESS